MRKFFLLLAIGLWVFLPMACGETLHASPEGTSLTEALAAARDGDTIALAGGTYAEPRETFPLVVAHRVTLCAEEGVRPVIDAPAFATALDVKADGVTLQGLTIGMERTGVCVTGDDFTMRDCGVALADAARRTSSCGVWLGGVQRACFDACHFTGCGIAMAGPPISEASAGKPVLTGLFEVGDDSAYFTTHTIKNCTVNGRPLVYRTGEHNAAIPTEAGEVILAGCRDIDLHAVDVSDGSIGITLAYCEDFCLTGCRADRCGIFGIYLACCNNGEVDGCTVDATNHGIDLRASRQITVRNCAVTNCEQGIFLSHVNDSIVTGCSVAGTGQGFFLAGGDRNMAVNCAATACENGFNIQKENDMLLTGCTMEGNTVCAARLDASATTFTDNTLRNNWVGVMAYGDVSFTLADNRFQNSESCGLYLRDIAYSRIVNNVFTGSRESSVQAHGELNGTALEDNQMDVPQEIE